MAFLILSGMTVMFACVSAFAASAPPVSDRIGNGWDSERACVAANGGKPWCRQQDCGRVSTGPCIGQPKRVIWFYMPPFQQK